MFRKPAKLKAVQNISPRPRAAKEYAYLWVENVNGSSLPLLFTANQIQVAANRAQKNPEDLPRIRRGLLRRIFR